MALFQIIIAVMLNHFTVGYIEFKPSNKEISYCKLKWEDFKIKKVKDNTAAESVTSIGYEYKENNGVIKVNVFCTFDRNESYVTSKNKTNHILNHEQRHFDITYIYAMKMVKQLREEKELNDYLVDVIYTKILFQKETMQAKYDAETNYSEDKKAQQIWDEKINQLLINL